MALSYKVFPGTPYYSNTSLTTKAGEIVNTTAATYVNTTYGTVSVGGSTYYVAYGMMVSFWNSSFTGAQIDDALNKVVNADTTPTANSTKMVTSGGVKAAMSPESLSISFETSTYFDKSSTGQHSWAYKVGNILVAYLYITVQGNKTFSDWVNVGTIAGWNARDISSFGVVQRWVTSPVQYDVEISKTGVIRFFSNQTTYNSALRVEIIGVAE